MNLNGELDSPRAIVPTLNAIVYIDGQLLTSRAKSGELIEPEGSAEPGDAPRDQAGGDVVGRHSAVRRCFVQLGKQPFQYEHLPGAQREDARVFPHQGVTELLPEGGSSGRKPIPTVPMGTSCTSSQTP